MYFKKTKIKNVLSATKKKAYASKDILREVYEIFGQNERQRARIQQTVSEANDTGISLFDFDILDRKNIYHIDQIKKICIDYRLRFLDSRYFKGDIPEAAISEIRRLEAAHGIEISGLKIIAPSKLFKLKDKDDPLLFASMGNDYYYFIYQWGNDLHPLRKLLMWPFKNIVNLTLFVFVLSYFVALMIPLRLFSASTSGFEFWIIFFFMFKSIAAVVIFYGFASGKNFSTAIWKSKYMTT